MKVNKFNEEVLFAIGKSLTVGRGDIEFLKNRSKRNERKRIRLCTHQGIEDSLHEMFIVHAKGTYIRPHKHLKAESLHIIEGSADLVIFGDKKKIIEVVPLGDYLSQDKFYYRILKLRYHTLLIKSEILVFHEVKTGPFNRSDTVFAPWAPQENSPAEAREFMRQLLRAVKEGEEGNE